LTPSLLADEIVSSTELNRRPAEILAKALENPVTVTTKNGDCVILGRDLAARLFQDEQQLRYLIGVAEYVLARFFAVAWTPQAAEFRWLDGFEKDDVLEFFKEYCETLRDRNSTPADLAHIIHEWEESAAALQNKVLIHVVESTRKS
jgi:hypothetical protein